MGARTLGEAKKSINAEKKRAVRIAKDLCYPVAIVEAIKNAISVEEISKILRRARVTTI